MPDRRRQSVVPMSRAHIRACTRIVSRSEPWKTLGEGIDFPTAIRKRQAYVCLHEGAIAGFVVFTSEPVFARGGYLRAIGVDPDMRRHGVGKQLLSFAEKTAARKSEHFFLCVSSFNRSARTFYRTCGYRKVGRIDGLIRQGMSEDIYWKKLR